MSVGYFQPLASRRNCLKKDIAQIDTTKYTHIHYAFATLTNNFSISVDGPNDYPDQWAKFLQLQGVKRVVSFGAGPIGDQIFRQGVTTNNIRGFANNLVSFVKQTPQIDGIEFDWEFPKTDQEGANYGLLFALVKAALPDKIVSAALPSGFWNLKFYPANAIGSIVDYVVYMTYDMHGIWNFGENYPESSGCPQGKCVRSHVNMTETMDNLVSITKAGLQASKIVVGLASYGRSFELAVPGCSELSCQFTSNDAKLGRCTQSAGILALGEINEIIGLNQPGTKHWYDVPSDSKIMIYNNTQWVAYMDPSIEAARTAKYRDLGFGGVVDWSIDQQGIPPI
jgi:GH18 family chitinase